ncbi:MAG: MarC family protein [Sheuella sp.]|nr:MarC family protein [Sheuella sp.]
MLTVVMLTDNDTRTIAEQVQTTLLLALCLSVYFVSFFLSGFIKKVLGETGIATVSRIFGLILTSIAVTGIIAAIKISFGLNG